jgi:hypothetical protein
MTHVPPQFRKVEFANTRTWHHAPLREWLEMRAKIEPRSQVPGDVVSSAEYLAIRSEAFHQIMDVGAARNRTLGMSLSRRQLRAIDQLIEEKLAARGTHMPTISPWEVQFLRNSRWLTRIEAARTGKRSDDAVIRILADFCLKADRDRDALLAKPLRRTSNGGTQHRRTRGAHGKHVVLPDPIELIQIQRLARLLIAHLKNGAKEAERLGLEANGYGEAYPCRKCGKKHGNVKFAEHCCTARFEKDLRAALMRALPIYSTSHVQEILKFMKLIWEFEYDTVPLLVEVETWPFWKKLTTTATGEFVEAFLGKIFEADAKTVRRHLTSSTLLREYKKYRISPRFRAYLGRDSIGAPARLRARGWYRRDQDNSSGYPQAPRCRVVVKW